MTCEHACGDLGGVPGNRLTDERALAAVLLRGSVSQPTEPERS
ncbi:MAG: hypothetical protein ACREMR_10770 [Gemmatimonadales bacterium]